MKVDTVITLDNNINCLLLDKATFNGTNYFLAVVLDERNEPTDDSVVFREIVEGPDTYVEREGDESVLKEVMTMFTKSFNKMVSEINEDDI